MLRKSSKRQKNRLAWGLACLTGGIDAGIAISNCIVYPALIPVSVIGTLAGVAYAAYIYHRPMEWTVFSVVVGMLLVIPTQHFIFVGLPSGALTDYTYWWFLLYGVVLPGAPMSVGQFIKIANQYKYNSDLRRGKHDH